MNEQNPTWEVGMDAIEAALNKIYEDGHLSAREFNAGISVLNAANEYLEDQRSEPIHDSAYAEIA